MRLCPRLIGAFRCEDGPSLFDVYMVEVGV